MSLSHHYETTYNSSDIQTRFRLIVAEMSDMRYTRRKMEIYAICRQIFGSLIAIVDNKLLNDLVYDL